MKWQASSEVRFCLLNRHGNFSDSPSLANLGFAPRNIRVMTDEMENPWDLPTKENIVRLPCQISLKRLFFSAARDAGIGPRCSTRRLPFSVLYVTMLNLHRRYSVLSDCQLKSRGTEYRSKTRMAMRTMGLMNVRCSVFAECM